ncbi:MAG: hypothetical protein ACE5EA_10365 [Nitrospirota bacterium]
MKKVVRHKGRKTWKINPVTRVHSTKKGKKGYNRKREKMVQIDNNNK